MPTRKARPSETVRWSRKATGPGVHRAKVEGVDGSVTSRRDSGERTSAEAEEAARLRRIARHSALKAEAIVAGYLAEIEDVTGARFKGDPDAAWRYLHRRHRDETIAESESNLAEIELPRQRSREAVREARTLNLVKIREALRYHVALGIVERTLEGS